MEILANKRIGKAIIIVEDEKHEFTVIKRVFSDVLGYTQIQKRRNRDDYYFIRGDSKSVVAVINSSTSNIASINDIDYLDGIFERLIEEYDFDINNSAIYYLFDRDPVSNQNSKLICNLIDKLGNSRDNANNLMGGMLVLSYPSIEAYEISNFVDESYNLKAKLGRELKQYIVKNAKTISINKIDKESIVHATKELLSYLERNNIALDLDDLAVTNERIYCEEEQEMKRTGEYHVLSMLSCVLMDLGIIKS